MSIPASWDLFCRVVDNFGDIGVCWRLARRLASMGAAVRLWLDDVASLAVIVPDADPRAAHQSIDGIEVWRWTGEWFDVQPAQVCVEGFGCGVPDAYVAAMAAREPRTLWIVLEYLSAEPWVGGHHGLASPHPRFPVPRYFFFPGFQRGTGGLLREPDLTLRRDAWSDSSRAKYWADAGFEPPAADRRVASIFAYHVSPLPALLEHWAAGAERWVAAIPAGKLAAAAAVWCGMREDGPGARGVRGAVEVRVVPFVPQARYDETLWSADVLFVRGEDSFVRAQWAARPFVWHIYPQEEGAHRRKLDAFLHTYCAGLPDDAAQAVREMWHAWNQDGGAHVSLGPAWDGYWRCRDVLQSHAGPWADRIARAGELAENLAEFCRDKLKY